MDSFSDGTTPRSRLVPTGQIRIDGVPLYTETRPRKVLHWPTMAGLLLHGTGSARAALTVMQQPRSSSQTLMTYNVKLTGRGTES